MRSINFFEALGFSFNPQFTDANATCMLVGEDAYFMLLTKEHFMNFSKRPVGDPRKETNAMFALEVNSRDEVDELVKKAMAAGGSHAAEGAWRHQWRFLRQRSRPATPVSIGGDSR